VVVALIALGGYVVTLAPHLTFWDAGEFITAARTLGIPHPPGTPLYVLLAHVWGLLPLGEYAERINLFSAVCSAAACGLWFLVAQDIVWRMHPDADDASRRVLAIAGGACAALLGAFTFSVWQNATEAEVYASASVGIAAVAWCATQWRSQRETGSGAPQLLLIGYLLALLVADHMMGLLVGPAAIALLLAERRCRPLTSESAARAELARIALLGAAWVMIVAIGLAYGALVIVGLVMLALATAFAWRQGERAMAAAMIAVVLVGVSALLFLLVRGREHPLLDQGNPGNWHNLIAAISRAQYPPRTPFDDPTVMHGAGNPGRTLTLLVYQLGNFAQYFDWQWARSLGDPSRPSIPRLAITLAMATLGIRGAFAHRRRDPASFAMIMTLFLVAGPVLVLYLNFKPGPSIGWNVWARGLDHEVRDRDYFFVASFVAWSIWVGIALADAVRHWAPRLAARHRGWALAVCGVAVIPFAGNFRDASRRLTAESDFPRDFGRALLQSVPPDGILFTYGDNDTFPLWYLQQVEGVRPDVTVICLALTQANWYISQLRDMPHVDATDGMLPAIWQHAARPAVNWPVHPMSDSAIDAFVPYLAIRREELDLPPYGQAIVPVGAAVEPLDLTLFAILRTNAGRRPVAWALSADDALHGLGSGLVQQGMVYVMPIDPVDSANLIGGAAAGTNGIPLDVTTTRTLVDQVWHFGKLETEGDASLDPNIRAVAMTATQAITQVGLALAMRGDTVAAVAELRRAKRISGDSLAVATLVRWGR
jgi:hypothetical protein